MMADSHDELYRKDNQFSQKTNYTSFPLWFILSYSKHDFYKMSTELHRKRFLLSHFLPLSTQCSFVYVARANQIWCRTHIQQQRREKRTQHKKVENALFFKTFPKSFCARYERNIYNFCSNISCDCERKKIATSCISRES